MTSTTHCWRDTTSSKSNFLQCLMGIRLLEIIGDYWRGYCHNMAAVKPHHVWGMGRKNSGVRRKDSSVGCEDGRVG